MKRGRDVTGQFNLRLIIFVDVSRNVIDMNETALTSLVPETRFVFDRVVANCHDRISGVEELVGRLIVKQTDSATEAVEELSRHYSRSLVCAHHRQSRFGEQNVHGIRRARLAREQTEHQQWPLRPVDQSRCCSNRFSVRAAEHFWYSRCQHV